ncbi:MAG: hypothetical protein AB2A00_27435 [Myxococcota bacterium]
MQDARDRLEPLWPPLLEKALWLLLGCGATLPLLLPERIASVDLWNHVAIHEVQRQALRGEGHMVPFYALHLDAYPYYAGYVVLGLWRLLLPPEMAAHAALASAHVLWVAAVWWLCRVWGCRRELALLAFAGCYSMSTWYGFLSYALALPLVVVAVVWATRLMDAPRADRVVITALVLLLLYEAHVESYAAGGVLAGGTALLHRDRWRRLSWLLAASLPSLLLAAWWCGTLDDDEKPKNLQYLYGPLKDRLGEWHAAHLWQEGWAGMVPGLVLTVAAAALVQARWGIPLPPRMRPALGWGVGALALHLLLPKEVHGSTWGLSLRTGPFLVLAALLCWQWLPRWCLRVGIPVVAAVCLLRDVQAWSFHQRFSEYTAPVVEQLKRTPPGARAVVVNRDDRVLGSRVHHLGHVAALWVVYGAVTRHIFEFAGSHLGVVREIWLPPASVTMDEPPDRWAHRLDRILLQGHDEEFVQRALAAGYEPIWQHDRWIMFAPASPWDVSKR